MAPSLVLRMEPTLFCVWLYGLSSSYFLFGWKDWKRGMECSYNTVATVTSGPYVSATYPSHPYLLLLHSRRRSPLQWTAPAGHLACPPPASSTPVSSAFTRSGRRPRPPPPCPAALAGPGLLCPPWPPPASASSVRRRRGLPHLLLLLPPWPARPPARRCPVSCLARATVGRRRCPASCPWVPPRRPRR